MLEENSFFFYDHHALGTRGAEVPPGYRAVWEDRGKLAVAKLGPRLTRAIPESNLPQLLLHPGRTRPDDDFIEVAIYAESTLDTRDVDKVTLHRTPSTPEEHHRWEIIREICVNRGIPVG